MQQLPGIDLSLIREHCRLGYTEGEIKDILDVLKENANNAGYRPSDPQQPRSINRVLEKSLQRFRDALSSGQYDVLLNAGYTEIEIRNVLFTNLLSTTQLLDRTESAHDSGEYERLCRLGSTDVEIRSLLRANFTVSQLRAVANRINDAQRHGVDSQGLTIQQIDDMLFKKRSMNNVRTLGVVQALLSGIHSKVCEGNVARCIIDYVTLFDVPYGPWGTDGQVDVGTRRIIVEAKVDSVTGDQLRQIRDEINNDVMNPPDAKGMRKFVILYAPNYNDSAAASIREAGGYVAKSCEQLREQIRLLGGP